MTVQSSSDKLYKIFITLDLTKTSRFAFDSYFGRRYLGYLGYLGPITRLVSRRDYHPYGPDNQKDFASEIFMPKKLRFTLTCCFWQT